jgi:hypothetical protein
VGQLATMNRSPMKCFQNQAISRVSTKVDGSQSRTSFFIDWTDTRAPRKVNGTMKNTSIKIGSAHRPKKVCFMAIRCPGYDEPTLTVP